MKLTDPGSLLPSLTPMTSVIFAGLTVTDGLSEFESNFLKGVLGDGLPGVVTEKRNKIKHELTRYQNYN